MKSAASDPCARCHDCRGRLRIEQLVEFDREPRSDHIAGEFDRTVPRAVARGEPGAERRTVGQLM